MNEGGEMWRNGGKTLRNEEWGEWFYCAAKTSAEAEVAKEAEAVGPTRQENQFLPGKGKKLPGAFFSNFMTLPPLINAKLIRFRPL